VNATTPSTANNSNPPEADNLTQRVLNWADTMREPGAPVWRYRMDAGSDATVFNSCFAAHLLHLFGRLDDLSDRDRADWVHYLQEFQSPDSGLFSDPQISNNSQQRPQEHMDWQLTTFCLTALDALGAEPLHDLSFAMQWTHKETLFSWFESLDWYNPWHCGNKVMFVGVFLYFLSERRNNHEARTALNWWFEWLDQHQNSRSGYWGKGKHAAYFAGMGGAYHEYVIYNALSQPIQYREQIVDSTLRLQQMDGLFAPPRSGGSCDDLDAVDILVNSYHNLDYRRPDITHALERALQGILNNQNQDGGFCWAAPYRLGISDYVKAAFGVGTERDLSLWAWNLRRTIRDQRRIAQEFPIKTGWNYQPRHRQTSSIFDTWLRCAAIGEISTVITETPFASIDWQFLNLPGLGWFQRPPLAQ